MTKNKTLLWPGNVAVFQYVCVCLVVLIFSVLLYRVENPSIVVREAPPEKTMSAMAAQENPMMQEVGALMQRLQQNPDDAQTQRALAELFLRMGAWQRSLTFWDMILQDHDGADVHALNRKAQCLFELKRFDEAAQVLQNILEKDVTNARARYGLGILQKYYFQTSKKAAASFRQIIHDHPQGRFAELARKELEK